MPTSNFQPIRLLDLDYCYNFTYLMANSADPDQLASSEAKWSGSTLFAKAGYIRVQQDKHYERTVLAGAAQYIGRENQLISCCLFWPKHLTSCLPWIFRLSTNERSCPCYFCCGQSTASYLTTNTIYATASLFGKQLKHQKQARRPEGCSMYIRYFWHDADGGLVFTSLSTSFKCQEDVLVSV